MVLVVQLVLMRGRGQWAWSPAQLPRSLPGRRLESSRQSAVVEKTRSCKVRVT